MHIAIVAGEASGDQLGAGLMAAIKQRHPDAVFSGIGGPKMIAEGFQSHFDAERLAVMGFVEPLKRLPELLRIRKSIRQRYSLEKPDVFLGIDSPGFNIDLERSLKEQGVITAHYVSPQVWAWRQKRVKKIAASVDLMLTLFPFEAKFYAEHQVDVAFVGHPLADKFPIQPETVSPEQWQISGDRRVVALLPGSRGSEVALLLPNFLLAAEKIAQEIPNAHFLLPSANDNRHQQMEAILSEHQLLANRITLVKGQSHQVMAAAELVMMASGTTTLEALLLKKPMVVAYKFPALSYAIYSRLVKIPYVSLPNILAGHELVPELIQKAATPGRLAQAALKFLQTPAEVSALLSEFSEIHQSLKCQASERAAEALLNLINKRAAA